MFVCRFRLDERYSGPPGHCHGGIIATILDEAMGKVNRLREVIAMTAQMKIDYLRPVPLNKPLRVESQEVSVRGRKHINIGEILNQKGEALARGEGLFIAIDPQRCSPSTQNRRSKLGIDLQATRAKPSGRSDCAAEQTLRSRTSPSAILQRPRQLLNSPPQLSCIHRGKTKQQTLPSRSP